MSIQTVTEARLPRRSTKAAFDPAAWLARAEAQGYEVHIGHDEQGGQNLAIRETEHPGFLLHPERRPELADTAGNEQAILRHLRTIGRVGMAHYKVQSDMPEVRGMTETDHLRAGDSLVVGSIPGLTRPGLYVLRHRDFSITVLGEITSTHTKKGKPRRVIRESWMLVRAKEFGHLFRVIGIYRPVGQIAEGEA